jgi:hypothetical protein
VLRRIHPNFLEKMNNNGKIISGNKSLSNTNLTEAYRQYCTHHNAPESRVIIAGYQSMPKRRFQLLLDELTDDGDLESLINILHRNNFGLQQLCITLSQRAYDEYQQKSAAANRRRPLKGPL